MAEPPEAPGAEAAASERDVLLATKRHVPGPRPGLVPRPRLTERLDAELGRGLVLVCAPAGYGKTVLLANWAQRAQFPVAWLSLDAGDNDPARFWRHAVAALDRVRPGVAGRVGPLLGPPAPPSFEPLVTALINELAAQPGDDGVLLVLDDYPRDRRPAAARLGRVPGQPLRSAAGAGAAAGPRSAGRGARRGSAVHRRRGSSAAAASGSRPDMALPDAAVAALAARTEGWAAGAAPRRCLPIWACTASPGR